MVFYQHTSAYVSNDVCMLLTVHCVCWSPCSCSLGRLSCDPLADCPVEVLQLALPAAVAHAILQADRQVFSSAALKACSTTDLQRPISCGNGRKVISQLPHCGSCKACCRQRIGKHCSYVPTSVLSSQLFHPLASTALALSFSSQPINLLASTAMALSYLQRPSTQPLPASILSAPAVLQSSCRLACGP
jgi:hypothetical protein